ncbi:hypothetical protein EBL_c10490 [Shimwellia blattae DSM 4481 = NBRC 105725]|uniref:Uncharacterized protein n=1 Tax=Shimwellia blattae (strain ATCC 29907 / DSM 4481 / JCM 1650 / NBRC 105725 / CDC 9005-74) TaxID=630626 RepID=I2B6K5_SHIBC|nr:hypothetical protein EBL_c10490 [Shimwellia blattae DSM 4481 = NBRC 105725]GAB81199.1 hypothetical protein EB105725_12_00990 [Shimwellia blattae DSM 4481 = NBRC 105725]VDY63628.1 Uncharacterised protein [Shimwellia blattae]VEC21692.1 Uncharacterised protein [Shimwellia blattae]
MNKTIIALSTFLLTAPVFANTVSHATDETVAQAHKTADTAKEKLHQAQDHGKELKLKSEHAAQGKSDDLSSKVSEGSQKAWNKTKQGTEKAWDKTKQGSEKAWDKTKQGSEKAWDKTKEGSEKAWDKTKEGTSKAWDATKEGAKDLKDKVAN